MNRQLTYMVLTENENMTILDFLKAKGISSHLITHLKKTANGITLNGKWAYVTERLRRNDLVCISIVEEEPSQNIVPVNIPVDIAYEDEDIIVVDKPSNMPVHPSVNNFDNTLANALAYYYKNADSPFVFRCINRLDRDTTGLVLVAKNMLSSCILSNMVRNKDINREYMAIVQGDIDDSGTIDAPIKRKENSVIERTVSFEDGVSAITHYNKILYKNGFSLVKIKLETGRTHQIRVHMKYINHPLPGDYLYNQDFKAIKRQALHSYSLSFNHPVTKEPLILCSDIPSDMKAVIN